MTHTLLLSQTSSHWAKTKLNVSIVLCCLPLFVSFQKVFAFINLSFIDHIEPLLELPVFHFAFAFYVRTYVGINFSFFVVYILYSFIFILIFMF